MIAATPFRNQRADTPDLKEGEAGGVVSLLSIAPY
jgi:hypothetical protein